MSRFVVITNDLQYAATYKHEQRKNAVEEFLPRMVEFLDKMRKAWVSVIHLQLVNSDDDPRAIGQPDELKFIKGSQWVKILSQVLNPTDMIIEKPKDSGFFETNLDEVLKKLGCDTVIVCGMQTQICVQITAADAYFRGYKVYVPSDCVVSTRREDMDKSLEWLKDYCAEVLPWSDIYNIVLQKNA